MDQSKLDLGDSISILLTEGENVSPYQLQTCPYPSKRSHEPGNIRTTPKERWLLHALLG